MWPYNSGMTRSCRALLKLLAELPQDIKGHVTRLCIDGTSSTALLVDRRRGDVLAPTKIYNEDQGSRPLEAIKVVTALCVLCNDQSLQQACSIALVSGSHQDQSLLSVLNLVMAYHYSKHAA